MERYSRLVNLSSVAPYVLRFCYNSHYLNARRIGIGIQYIIICLHLYGAGSTYDGERADFKYLPELKKISEFHNLCPF
jgi:hypothetical protein